MLQVHTSANNSLGICTLECSGAAWGHAGARKHSHFTGRHRNGVSCLKTAGAAHQFKFSELPFLNASELPRLVFVFSGARTAIPGEEYLRLSTVK